MMLRQGAIVVVLLVKVVFIVSDGPVQCNLPSDLKEEIASYTPLVEKIINSTLKNFFKGVTHSELAVFVDTFGNRISGSQNLENSIDYMIKKLVDSGLDNVHGEEVKIPHWIRGPESALLIEPRNKSLNILGLGNTVGTSPEGISAEVLVVKSFEELKTKSHLVEGKIVVFNQKYVNYSSAFAYRKLGAIEAAKLGAVACLVRSLTPFSMNTPHTGVMVYEKNVTKIPAACITVEDAQFLQRLQDRNQTMKILLRMGAKNLPEVTSRNAIAEIRGRDKPEKVVIVSGHIDSWDVGEGALDDGGGVFVTWGALDLLKKLGLRPRRTIRGIFWTGEEFGLIGAKNYAKVHANETENFVFVMESDSGTFNPVGLKYAAGNLGGCILQEILNLLSPINATTAKSATVVGSDISIWTSRGIPGASLDTENDKYFWYHHSPADTMEIEDPEALDKNTALWASLAYIIADLSVDFPREKKLQ